MNLNRLFKFKIPYLGVMRVFFLLMLAASTANIDVIPPTLPPPSNDDPIQLEQTKVHKIQFYAALEAESHQGELTNKQAKHKRLPDKTQYEALLKEIEDAYQMTTRKSHRQYHLFTTYEIYQVGPIKKIIGKRDADNQAVRYLVALEDVFDAIATIHKSVGHKGRDVMRKHAQKTYLNLTDALIDSNFFSHIFFTLPIN